MARTFEEQTREEAEEAQEGLRSIGPGLPEGFDWSGLANIVRAIPELLKPGAGRNRERRRAEERQSFRELLSELLGESIGSDFFDIDEALAELNELEFPDASPIDQAIFQANLTQANTLKGILEAEVTMATILDSIATAVEPPVGITVSGTNQIDDADTPESVIPNAADKEIPVKHLWIRASPDNTGPVYFGDDKTQPEDGFMLTPGEAESFQLDFREDALFMAAENEGETVQLLGVF